MICSALSCSHYQFKAMTLRDLSYLQEKSERVGMAASHIFAGGFFFSFFFKAYLQLWRPICCRWRVHTAVDFDTRSPGAAAGRGCSYRGHRRAPGWKARCPASRSAAGVRLLFLLSPYQPCKPHILHNKVLMLFIMLIS